MTTLSDSDDPNPSSKKRRRVLGACTLCGLRKSKCNGQKPVCDRCLRLGEACEWPVPKRRGPKPDRAVTSSSGDSHPGVERGNSAAIAAFEVTHRLPVSSDHPIESEPVSAMGSPAAEPQFGGMRVEEALDSSKGALVPIPNNSSDSPHGGSSHRSPATVLMMGASTGLPLLFRRGAAIGMDPSDADSNGDTAEHHLGASEVVTRSPAPSSTFAIKSLGYNQPVLGALLNHYFLYIHTVWPIIYKPSLPLFSTLDAIESLDTLVFYAICCVAARSFDHIEDLEKLGGADPHEIEQAFYDAAVAHLRVRILSTSPSNSNPSTCQALVLLALRNHHSGHLSEAWKYTGLASSLVIELGLNRSVQALPSPTPTSGGAGAGPSSSNGRPAISALVNEERKRIYWCTYSLSAILSAAVGRPVALRAADADVELPRLDEGDEFEYWGARPYQSELKGSASDSPDIPKSRCVSSLIALAKLSRILEQIVSGIYAVNRTGALPGDEPILAKRQDNQDTMLELLAGTYAQLKAWKKALPPYLNVGPSSATLVSFRPPRDFWLAAWYHACLVLLFRNFVPTSSGTTHSLRTSPQKICTNAARSICRLFALHEGTHGMYKIPPAWSYLLFTAATTHAANATSLELQSFRGLDQCLVWFRRLSQDWPPHGLSQHAYSVLSKGRASQDGVALYKRALELATPSVPSITDIALQSTPSTEGAHRPLHLPAEFFLEAPTVVPIPNPAINSDDPFHDWPDLNSIGNWDFGPGLDGVLASSATSGVDLFFDGPLGMGSGTRADTNVFDAIQVTEDARDRLQNLLNEVGEEWDLNSTYGWPAAF